MLASDGEQFATVLVDPDDYLMIGDRSLSIGSHGYPQLWVDQKMQTLHRWLLGLTGQGYRRIVDHVNRAGLDNRRVNLRVVSPSESNLNRQPSDNPMVGVHLVPSGRYAVSLKRRRQIHYLGTHDTAEAAQAAVLAFRKERGEIPA